MSEDPTPHWMVSRHVVATVERFMADSPIWGRFDVRDVHQALYGGLLDLIFVFEDPTDPRTCVGEVQAGPQLLAHLTPAERLAASGALVRIPWQDLGLEFADVERILATGEAPPGLIAEDHLEQLVDDLDNSQ